MPSLIATALTARGSDIHNVKHVSNFYLPSDIEEYAHRVERSRHKEQIGSAIAYFLTVF